MIGAEDRVLRTSTGRQVGYLMRGPAGGRPVLYVHGMPGSRLEQRFIPDTLLDALGVRLVSVDRPGYGQTDAVHGDRPARIADLLAVCDYLELNRLPVIAVSAGGSYAVALAATHPERVQRLVLASAQMPYDDEEALGGLVADQRDLLPALRLGRVPAVVDGAEAFRAHVLADPVAAMTPSLATFSARERELFGQPWFQEVLAAEMREGLRRSSDGLLDDLLAWPTPLEVSLSDVRCPVRAIHGSADDWEPIANLRRFLPMLSDAQLFVADGLNHLVPELFPRQVLTLAISDE
jgi:pimeloyl-ACP methyl ester carboxylesterase